MTTPTLSAALRQKIEERERQMQTSFPAKVISLNSTTGCVTVEPQLLDVWREGGERTTGQAEKRSDNYIQHVPVLFPRSGDFSITFPIAAGSFGLVTCTKYSLDVWREAATASDPGDLRRFTMSGAVFHPVNLNPTSGYLQHDGGDYITLSKGGTAQFVALANKVNDELDALRSYINGHTHDDTQPGVGVTGVPTVLKGAMTDVDAAHVKAE